MKKGLLVAFLGLLALALTVPAAEAAGTGAVSGRVVRWNGDAVAGATIAALRDPQDLNSEIAHTTSAADGSWSLQVPVGTAVWVNIHTFGTWWGYSYQTPFTLRDGETVSQIYFAVGPRDVKEITLPSPVSNIPSTPPTVTLPTATPAPVAPTPPPVSQVLPEVGSNNPPPVAHPGSSNPPPVHSVPNTPATLPQTGAALATWPALALVLAALALIPAGLLLRRRAA